MVVPNDTEKLYEEYRPLLFSLAYRMLSAASDAEDIVQDVFLRLEEKSPGDREHMKAYLCKMTVNRCLDVLKSARLQRELYIGPWLPEPIPTADDDPSTAYLRDEGISFAILLLLETLDPVERAVYILREAFAFDYKAIAEAIGRSEAACRQTMSRLRPKIAEARSSREMLAPAEAEPLALQFLYAARTGDLNGMLELLHPDAVLRSDGGGRVTAATRPIVGAGAVAAFLSALARKFGGDEGGAANSEETKTEGATGTTGTTGKTGTAAGEGAEGSTEAAKNALFGVDSPFQWQSINGQPGFLYREAGQVDTAFVIEAAAGRIQNVYIVRNPEKLQRIDAWNQ